VLGASRWLALGFLVRGVSLGFPVCGSSLGFFLGSPELVLTPRFRRHRPQASAMPKRKYQQSHASFVPSLLAAIEPLREGPALSQVTRPRNTVQHVTQTAAANASSDRPDIVRVNTYARGSKQTALNIAMDPTLRSGAVASFRRAIYASSSTTMRATKKETWRQVAEAAGFSDPFTLTTELIETVAGILKASNYRSAGTYLSIASQSHITKHGDLSADLELAITNARRSARRGLGPSKHTKELPFLRLAELDGLTCGACGSPSELVPAAVVGCWFLCREIEIASMDVAHFSFRSEGDKNFVDLYIPSQKTDTQAEGCTRTHTCTCSSTAQSLCPYHVALKQVTLRLEQSQGAGNNTPMFPSAERGQDPTFRERQTKAGFIAGIHTICKALSVPIQASNGAVLVTGHVCRATGAVFLAASGVDLWRIQLLGRWGSEAIKLYIRDAPLQAMSSIALEAFMRRDIADVIEELRHIKGSLEHQQRRDISAEDAPPIVLSGDCQRSAAAEAQPMLALFSAAELLESSVPGLGPRLPKDGDALILNFRAKDGPKLHSCHPMIDGKSTCGWRFDLAPTAGKSYTSKADVGNLCADCFGLRRAAVVAMDVDSASSSDS
jgi:hypothetical protein